MNVVGFWADGQLKKKRYLKMPPRSVGSLFPVNFLRGLLPKCKHIPTDAVVFLLEEDIV